MIVAHIALVVNTTILVGKCKWPEGQWCSRGGRWSKIHSGISTASLSCPPLPILSTISWSESSLTITSYLRNSNHLLILPTTTYILQNTNHLVRLVNHLLFYHHSVSRTISNQLISNQPDNLASVCIPTWSKFNRDQFLSQTHLC